jgi:hypothetical protein
MKKDKRTNNTITKRKKGQKDKHYNNEKKKDKGQTIQ